MVTYEPRPFTYLYNPVGNQLGYTGLNQQYLEETVDIGTDADFMLMAWYISLYTGPFQIQLFDSYDYALMSGYLNSAALSQSACDPTVFVPGHPFAAGGRIKFNINNLYGAANPLQIAFVGEKMFRVETR